MYKTNLNRYGNFELISCNHYFNLVFVIGGTTLSGFFKGSYMCIFLSSLL